MAASKATKAKAKRVRPTVLTNPIASMPLYPVDEVYPKPPPPKEAPSQFAAVIDPTILLSEDAQRRIEKTLRQAVLAEIAQLDFGGDIAMRQIGGGGTQGIQIFAMRGRG